VAVLQPETGARWIIDASPDLPEQLQLLPPRGDGGASALLDRSPVDRSPVDGVLLTHAHIGHYLGLAFFGFEAVHTQELPVHATPAMSDFLSAHAPWQQLVQRKNIALRPSPAGVPFELGTLEVTPLAVPHRDEYADTVAYRLRGARATILYLPDCAPWASWSTDPLAIFADVDVALVDGTFFSPDELPGRRLEETGHPLMRDTMDLLGPAVANKRLRVTFVHLNHSNPAVVPESPEAREVLRRGFAIAADGDEFPL
jgi:pyrroloquinoline quinone biosynthesis protein B